jgi:guanylate kinase
VFVQPPSVEELRKRLHGRGTDAPEVIEQRINKAEWELEFAPKFDVVIINDQLEEAIAKTEETIRKFLSA